MIEVGGEVEGEAVEGDAAFDADADGGDFGGRTHGTSSMGVRRLDGVDPDPYGGGVGEGGDAEVGEGLDDDLFEAVDVGADGEGVVLEADDRVGDQLAWAVVGDVAAAVGF